MRLRYIYILTILITGCNLSAQDVEFKAVGPKYVRVGEQFQLQYSVNKSIDDFTPPSFNDFDFLGGPMQGSSSQTTVINGKIVRNQSYTFTYYLRAKAPGEFTLEPAVAKYKNSTVESNEVKIEVVGSASNQGTGTNAGEQSPGATNGSGDELFIRIVTDKNSAYVGEAITAWIKIYTKVSLTDIDRNYKRPVFSGFYKQNVEIPPLTNLEREKVGDDIYYTGVLEKVVLFPQRAGKLVVEPFEITTYKQKKVRQSRSVFDDFFGPSYTSEPVKLKSKPLTINVKALPENKPEGFTGAVGQFSIKGSLNSNQVKTNDAVSFKITLSGKGNIKLIENIDYSLPSTMQIYDPVVKSNLDKSGKSGSKVFEITAIPRHAGNIDIKPFKLVYFDPQAKSYKTIKTQPFSLEVERGAGDTSSVVISNLSKEDVELLGSDIRYIKLSTNLKPVGSYLVDNKLYRFVYLLVVLGFFAIVLLKREQIKRNANQTQVKHKKASKIAKKRFKHSKELLKDNKLDLFYEEISRALWGYVSDKLNIPQSTLSTDNAKEALKKHNIEEELITELFDTISNCEYARYAPGAASKNPNEVFADAMNLLMKIEQKF